jgi:hypothetical protein
MNFKFLSRVIAIPLLALGISVGQTAPAWGDITLSSLVPTATIPLNPPVTCLNGVTVYDSGDLASLCVGPTLLAPLSPACPQTITSSGFFKLTGSVSCADTTWLTIGADNVVIDLNGFTASCLAPGDGYQGTCQEADGDDAGVDTNGHSNVHVFSSQPGGTLKGFDKGVWIRLMSSNVKVKQLTITGPASPGPFANPRPPSQGIAVEMANMPLCLGNIHLGGSVSTGNAISNFTEGIELMDSNCVEIGFNNIHDNNSDPVPCHGIHAEDSAHLNIHHNNVHNNGENLLIDGGITLDGSMTMDSILTGNTVGTTSADANNGDGISVRGGATGNMIVNNVMKHNGGALSGSVFFDAAARPVPLLAPPNFWGQNNVCITQTTPQPPPGTCTATS